MQLVACQSCHAQYDVTGVARGEIACACGAKVAVSAPTAVDAVVRRCSACGALVAEGARSCEYCGSAVVRDDVTLSLICPECFARNAEAARFCAACGVQFSPQPAPDEANDVDCPACGARLAARAVACVPLHECPECSGLWVPGDRFDELVQRAAERHREGGGVGAASAPRVKGANPARQDVRYRRCPECSQFMQRRNFRKTSGVIVDRCRSHGTWLDADELERIAGFLLTGGRPGASAFLRAEEARDEATYQRARRDNAVLRSGGRPLVHVSTTSEPAGLTLLGLLSDLLD